MGMKNKEIFLQTLNFIQLKAGTFSGTFLTVTFDCKEKSMTRAVVEENDMFLELIFQIYEIQVETNYTSDNKNLRLAQTDRQ